MPTYLDLATARQFARLTLGHVTREWPYKLDHVMTGPDDVRSPRDLHPIFFGSFDWHSCCHGWWQLNRLKRRFPDMPEAAEISALSDTLFTAENVAVETAYLELPSSAGFVRPYGWAWLFYLALEEPRVAPMAAVLARRWREYLGKATYPIRTGAHPNSAFAMILSRRWAAGERSGAARGDRRAGASLVLWRPRRAGVGARRGRVPVADVGRGAADARCARGRLRRLVRRVPPARGGSWSRHPVYARDGQRPQRRQDRASGWAEPVTRMVLARDRGGVAGGASGRGDRAGEGG